MLTAEQIHGNLGPTQSRVTASSQRVILPSIPQGVMTSVLPQRMIPTSVDPIVIIPRPNPTVNPTKRVRSQNNYFELLTFGNEIHQ